jgi:hypothetical protein
MTRVSTLLVSILCVTQIIALEEVVWINASPNVACVQNLFAASKITEMNHPGKPMCSNYSGVSFYGGSTVTAPITTPEPQPTIVGYPDETPEPFDIGIRNHCPDKWARHIFYSHFGNVNYPLSLSTNLRLAVRGGRVAASRPCALLTFVVGRRVCFTL